MNALAATGGVLYILLTGLFILIGVLWVLMPFAIFGTKDLLRQLLDEQKKTNALLQAQAERARAIRDESGLRP